MDGLLESYATNPLLKGVRHAVQDEADDQFILGDAFNKGIRRLKAYELVYDILIYERQLGPSIEFVDRHPRSGFRIGSCCETTNRRSDHGTLESPNVRISQKENVYRKLSGMATEANWQNWTKDDLWPYAEVAMEAFGPTRMMFGSDWSVARLAVEYGDWVGLCREFISTLSDSEQAMIEGEVAIRAYDLWALCLTFDKWEGGYLTAKARIAMVVE